MSLFSPATVPLWQCALLAGPAATAIAAAAIAARENVVAKVWTVARTATAAMVLIAVAASVVRAATPNRAGALLRSDTVGVAVLVLVSFVGWVVIRYSEAYIAGDPNERSYVVRMLATLAAVAVVVTTNNLVVLTLAWTSTSLALHGLLTFFPDRPVAVAVAHKKFLLARCADLAMIGAIAAFWAAFKTVRIDAIATSAALSSALPTSARVGIMLIGVAALLKCAQLPFHGWLIQVMEAPTPVSALLHAGIVNLGGFVLLRFAPVVDRTTEVRVLLVVVGALTAVVAALVMTTRVSVKVFLAWSTCAQMGFMLMQCGLGLWEMALLHLLAHSLYKAHAFLGSGGMVQQTQRKRLAPPTTAPSTASMAIAAGIAAAGAVGVGWLWGQLPFADPPSAAVWVMAGILTLALVPLTQPAIQSPQSQRFPPTMIIGMLGVPLAYFALHEVFSSVVAHSSVSAPPVLLAFVAIAFLSLFFVQTIGSIAPNSVVMQRLYPWVYGGLFLDEGFTRLAFKLSAPPAVRTQPHPLPQPSATPVFGSTAVKSGQPGQPYVLHKPVTTSGAPS